MKETKNRQWRLANRPEGLITEQDFSWREEPLRALSDGEILVRNVYLSLDPANRGWVTERESYIEPVEIGDVMRGIATGVVVTSKNPKFSAGDIVQGMIGWQDYLISNGKGLQKMPKLGAPLSAYLSVFGMVGLTAYFGLLDVGKPIAGETLVVSAAAGAVGSLVGQIGKITGCRVVGIAGSDEKCKWLNEELGFDAAINYKSESVYESLKTHCPDGVDVYFDNVGGEILDAVLAHINLKARIAVCGLISQYNAVEPVPGPYNFARVLVKRARIEGFIVLDYTARAGEAVAKLAEWYATGKLKYRAHVVEGLENTPTAINMLFDGSNKGKLIVKVSEEPE